MTAIFPSVEWWAAFREIYVGIRGYRCEICSSDKSAENKGSKCNFRWTGKGINGYPRLRDVILICPHCAFVLERQDELQSASYYLDMKIRAELKKEAQALYGEEWECELAYADLAKLLHGLRDSQDDQGVKQELENYLTRGCKLGAS